MSQDANVAERSFRCMLCNKCFSGPAPYMQHMQSAKHIKQKEKKEMLDQLSNGEEMQPPVGCPTGAVTSDPTPLSSSALRIREEIISKGLSPTLCGACQVPFTSPENALEHYRGKKHRRTAERLELQKCFGAKVDDGQDLPPKSTGGASRDEKDAPPSPKRPAVEDGVDAAARSVEIDEGSEPQKVVVRHAEGFGCKRCGILLFADLASALEHYESNDHLAKQVEQ